MRFPGSPCCCFITPPDLLGRLAEEGSAEEREAAVRTLATSAALRTQRALVGSLLRDDATREAALAFIHPPAGERRTVYDVENQGRSALPGRRVRGEGDPPVADEAVNEAYDGADKAYDFFNDVFGYDSVDGRGMELISSVHFGVDYDNAFWNGGQMVYGDGSDRIFRKGAFTKAIDVIGHELSHGVIQFTAGLEYRKQPGALNEHFADAFGSLVKQYTLQQTAEEADWLLGDGAMVPAIGRALRSLKEPGTAYRGDPQPDHMSKYKDLPDDNNPRNDIGGVHINSGIPNRAFYLAAVEIGGNAWATVGRIWWAALTGGRLRFRSLFVDAAEATVAASGEIFSAGGREQQAVQRAWQTVGVLT
jgi:Zn-dependent metalloprotease